MKRDRDEEDDVDPPTVPEVTLLLNQLMAVNKRNIVAADKATSDGALAAVLDRLAMCVLGDMEIEARHMRTVAELLTHPTSRAVRSGAACALRTLLGEDTVVGPGVFAVLVDALDTRPPEDHTGEFVECIIDIVVATLAAPADVVPMPPPPLLTRLLTFATTAMGAKAAPVTQLGALSEVVFAVMFAVSEAADQIPPLSHVVTSQHVERILSALAKIQQPSCPYAVLDGKSSESADSVDFVGSIFDALCLALRDGQLLECFVRLEGVELMGLFMTKRAPHLAQSIPYLQGQVMRIALHATEQGGDTPAPSVALFIQRVVKQGVLSVAFKAFDAYPADVQRRVVLTARNLMCRKTIPAADKAHRPSILRWVLRILTRKGAVADAITSEEAVAGKTLLVQGWEAMPPGEQMQEEALWDAPRPAGAAPIPPYRTFLAS